MKSIIRQTLHREGDVTTMLEYNLVENRIRFKLIAKITALSMILYLKLNNIEY